MTPVPPPAPLRQQWTVICGWHGANLLTLTILILQPSGTLAGVLVSRSELSHLCLNGILIFFIWMFQCCCFLPLFVPSRLCPSPHSLKHTHTPLDIFTTGYALSYPRKDDIWLHWHRWIHPSGPGKVGTRQREWADVQCLGPTHLSSFISNGVRPKIEPPRSSPHWAAGRSDFTPQGTHHSAKCLCFLFQIRTYEDKKETKKKKNRQNFIVSALLKSNCRPVVCYSFVLQNFKNVVK